MSAPKDQPTGMLTVVLAFILLFIACSMFWFFFKGPILEGLRWVRFAEMAPLTLINPKLVPCMDWLRHAQFFATSATVAPPAPTAEMMGIANRCFGTDALMALPAGDEIKYYNLTGTSMQAIEQMIAFYYKWVFVALFGYMGYYIIFVSPRNKFRMRHNLETFIRTQVKMWPVISPIVNFNPIKSSARTLGNMIPDKLPLFAEALSPEEWVSFHRIPVTNNIADREATRRAFLLQLGPRWNGSFTGQPPHIRALFAAFALKGVQKRDESDDLLGRLSVGWSPKAGFTMTPTLTGEIDRLLADPEVGAKALEIASAHAYRTTAMLAILRWARMMGGVLAPAQFLWLRGTDRDLWYALNNLGRRSFHSEGAGAIAHYMAEQNAKKALPIPRIDTALITLNQYLAGATMPIPQREGDPARQDS